MSFLSLPSPTPPGAESAFAPGSRRLAAPGRPVDRATLAHHIAVLPLPARTLALVTGSSPGDRPADVALVRWVAARLRALSTRLVAGEASGDAFHKEAGGLAGLGPDPSPAGEEMLVGLAAAARRLATGRLLREPAVAAFTFSLGGLAVGGASPAARKSLDDAARGGFPGAVADVVDILGDPDAEDGALKEAAIRLAAGGTRPGADSLAGIVSLVRDVALGPL